MNCDWTLEEVSAAIDGELTGARATEFLLHLRQCEKCRSYRDRLSEISWGIGQLEPPTVPDGFADMVLERARHQAPSPDNLVPLASHRQSDQDESERVEIDEPSTPLRQAVRERVKNRLSTIAGWSASYKRELIAAAVLCAALLVPSLLIPTITGPDLNAAQYQMPLIDGPVAWENVQNSNASASDTWATESTDPETNYPLEQIPTPPMEHSSQSYRPVIDESGQLVGWKLRDGRGSSGGSNSAESIQLASY